MDTQQLITFQKVAKELSFKRASRELGISQPTVTMRIKVLEKEIGETLIVRTGQKAVLTDAGVTFLHFIDRALTVFQSGIDKVMSKQECITIAGTPALNTFLIPNKLQLYKKQNPEVQFRIYTGTSDEIVQMMKDEIVDIGFIRGNIVSDKLHCYRLFTDVFKLVVHKEHPFTKRESVTLHDLENEVILTYKKNTRAWYTIEQHFRDAGLKPEVTMELDHVTAVKEMVAAGVGITFLPELTLEKLELDHLQIVELANSSIQQNTSLVLPKRKLPQSIQTFVSYVHEWF